jgi:hypothetical protein
VNEHILTSVMESIQSGRLVFLVGAGLSMGPPSELPSAQGLARLLVDQHRANTGEDLSHLLDADDPLDAVTDCFYARGRLEHYVFDCLIDWSAFRHPPNLGHTALADLVYCEAADVSITTNVDHLVETAARELGAVDLQGALDGNEMNRHGRARFLKLHGCCERQRDRTLWCKSQLDENYWKDALESSRTWLEGRLRERDIVIIGYWTDWSYLNDALHSCLRSTTPGRIWVVNPDSEERLKEKAPDLWRWANREEIGEFRHIRDSGEAFLTAVRRRMATMFILQVLQKGGAAFMAQSGEETLPSLHLDPASDEDLYNLRRDLTGVPRTRGVSCFKPDASWTLIGFRLLQVLAAGGHLRDGEFELNGQRIRLIHTPNQFVNEVQALFQNEQTPPGDAPILVCVGGADAGVPVDITRGGIDASVVRSGVGGTWMLDGPFAESTLTGAEHATP